MIISKYSLETEKKSPYDIKWTIGYSAPLEELFILNALVEPENHSYCNAWAKKTFSSLSDPLKKEILFFSNHYAKWIFITDVVEKLSSSIPSEDCTIETITKELKVMNLLDFAYVFLGFSAFGYDKKMIEAWFKNPDSISEEDLREQKKFFTLDDIIYFFKNAERIRDRLVWTLTQYWVESFHQVWTSFEPYLSSQISKEKELISKHGEIQYIRKMHPKISLKDGTFIFSKEPDFSIAVNEIEEIYINLSLFIGDGLAVNIIDNKLYLTKNLGFQNAIATSPSPELMNGVKALSDESRLKIIKVLSNGQATTKDLSEILNLSASATSLHLKQLKSANLLDCRKENKFVYYFLNDNALAQLEKMLEDYLIV